MEKNVCAQGPFGVSTKIAFTDGEQVAEAGFAFPPGKLPTPEDMGNAIRDAYQTIIQAVGGDWRLLTRHEYVCYQLTGCVEADIAIPGPDSFELDFPLAVN